MAWSEFAVFVGVSDESTEHETIATIGCQVSGGLRVGHGLRPDYFEYGEGKGRLDDGVSRELK